MNLQQLVQKLEDIGIEGDTMLVQFLGDDGSWHWVTDVEVARYVDSDATSVVAVIKGSKVP